MAVLGPFTFIMSSVLVFTLIKLVQVIQQTFKVKHSILKTLPGPMNVPIIGSFFSFLVMGASWQCDKFNNLCKNYGRIMGFQAGNQKILMIQDYETIMELVRSPDWSYRFPNDSVYKHHMFGQNLGLLFGNGDMWKDLRRYVFRTFHEYGFGELKIAEEYLHEELDYFTKHLDSYMKVSQAVEVSHIFKVPTLNIIWRMIAGQRLDYEDQKIQKLIEMIDHGSTVELGLHPIFAFPLLRPFSKLTPLDKFKKTYDAMAGFFKLIVDERKRLGHYKLAQSNFIDKMLQKIDEEKSNPSTYFTDDQLLITCSDLLGASVDTTANSLDFALIYMTKYPEVQRKVQEELDRVIGRNRTPDVFDRVNLPYTEATMLETLRLCNVVPFTLRASTCDTSVDGYFVPKGTMAGVNIRQIHMDPTLWDNPEEFRPERFLDENNKLLKNHKLFAFGGGKRLCMGFQMAKVIWIAFFSTILHRYTFDKPSDTETIESDPIIGFTSSAPKLKCVVRTRI